MPVGVIPPDAVRTPGMLVHHLVKRPLMEAKNIIARRVALELTTERWSISASGCRRCVAPFAPRLSIAFQTENGIIGFGPRPPEGMEDRI